MERILIVDDEAVNLKLSEFILKTKYENVDTVSSGEECLEALQKQYYDLVLLDLKMPGMSGVETLEAMRSSAMTRRIKVIVLTASGAVNDVLAVNKFNISGYVKKPMVPQILLEKVEAALAEEYF